MSERVIGKSVIRVDAPGKVTGQVKFAADYGTLPGMLRLKVLRSPHPHARILDVDCSKARRLPGVRAVVTADDLPQKRIGMEIFDRYPLASDAARFVGDPVAIVAADSVETAEEAVDLIEVSYEVLPAVFDPEEAAKEDPPTVIHPSLPGYRLKPVPWPAYKLIPERPNVFHYRTVRKGDVERGFREADVIVESTFTAAAMNISPLEPGSLLASYDGDTLTIWGTISGPHRIGAVTAEFLGLPASKVRVIAPYIGGHFGARSTNFTMSLAVGFIAMVTGRPVKLVETREETFLDNGTRPPRVVYIKDGVKKDGTLVARDLRVFLDAGAYAGHGANEFSRSVPWAAGGLYRTPNYKLDCYNVYTNLPPRFGVRGFGGTESVWAIEQQMDIIAERLGLDPAELRRRNILKEGEKNALGEVIYNIGAEECLNKALHVIEWGEKPKQEEGPWRTGKGFALCAKHTSTGFHGVAVVKLHGDGTIEVRHGTPEAGQGINTTATQIAAEEFGAPVDKIKVVSGDTALCPYDFGVAGSHGTFNSGRAILNACRDAKQKLFQLAAGRLGVAPEELDVGEGRVYVRGQPENGVNVSDMFIPGLPYMPVVGEILGTGVGMPPLSKEDPDTGQSLDGGMLGAHHRYGATAAEIAVNVETQEIKVLKVVSAFDVSRAINPKGVEQQCEGGAVQGIGSAIFEELKFDNGVTVNANFMDYKIPTFQTAPHGGSFRSSALGTPHKDGPYGAKGFGEETNITVPAAIGNAVYDAIGVRIHDLPISRERLYRAARGGKLNETV